MSLVLRLDEWAQGDSDITATGFLFFFSYCELGHSLVSKPMSLWLPSQ